MWEALEYDLISELVLMLDLPELPDELSDYLLGGDQYGSVFIARWTAPLTRPSP